MKKSKTERLLLVDDDRSLLGTYQSYLGDLGVDSHTAENPGEAIKLLQKNQYGLVISDYKMPDGGGSRLFRWIREHRPNQKFVFWSGCPEEIVETEVTCLSKPVTSETFEQLLADFFHHK